MSLLLKMFPLPHYLRIPATGIDVSDRSVKYIDLKKRKDDLRIRTFGQKSIAEGIIKAGVIIQKDKLIESLKSLGQGLDNHFVIASLPEEKSFLKTTQIPWVEESKIRKSLEVQIDGLIPLSHNEVIFDYEIADISFRKSITVVLSAFPLSLAEEYAYVFKKAGLIPLAFEIESQSIFRSLVGFNDRRAVMIIDFGKTRTSFIVGEKGIVKFASTISVAGGHIDRALAKNLRIDIFEAEEKKRKEIVLQRGENGGVLSNVLPVVSVIKDEAKRILDYWQSYTGRYEQKDKVVEKIILCGGDSNIPGLIEYLTHSLKIRVEIGNPWQNVTSFQNYVPEIERRESLRYVTSLGLALRSFKD